jgi:hypothetical protein
MKTAAVNAQSEQNLAKARAKEREQDLRRVISAQRVALSSQGSDPLGGSAPLLELDARRAKGGEQTIDDLETDARVGNTKSAGVSSLLGGISGASNSLLSYGRTRQEAKIR